GSRRTLPEHGAVSGVICLATLRRSALPRRFCEASLNGSIWRRRPQRRLFPESTEHVAVVAENVADVHGVRHDVVRVKQTDRRGAGDGQVTAVPFRAIHGWTAE